MRMRFIGLTFVAASAFAHADDFSFADWDKTTQTANSVTGTLQTDNGPVTATLTGDFTDVYESYDVYRPASSWVGGIVGNAPSNDDVVRIDRATTFTLTFSKPVTNLAYSLWSVGAPGVDVSYAFAQPFSLVAGGPNADYGGSALTRNGNTVTGNEGNGTLLFTGTYSSITWDVLGNEGFQTFTIGLQKAQTVPEPASILALGVGGLVFLRRRTRLV